MDEANSYPAQNYTFQSVCSGEVSNFQCCMWFRAKLALLAVLLAESFVLIAGYHPWCYWSSSCCRYLWQKCYGELIERFEQCWTAIIDPTSQLWLIAMITWYWHGLLMAPDNAISENYNAAYTTMHLHFQTHACMFWSCECALGGGSRKQEAERHGQQPAGEGQEVWSHSSHIRQQHLPSHLYISQPY